jgi:hypothetical protein
MTTRLLGVTSSPTNIRRSAFVLSDRGMNYCLIVDSQPVPIPSYLIAIAVGNVRYRPFNVPEDCGWTSGIWAEPEMITAAHWEFEEATTQSAASYRYDLPGAL